MLVEDETTGTSDWVDRLFVYDGGGHVRALTDLEGNITDTFSYDAYGNLLGYSLSAIGDCPTSYLYRGERWDNDLGQYYLRARFYDANLGRFHTLDEYEGRTGEPLSLHKYLYAHANPVTGWDPSGRMTLGEVNSVMGMIANLMRLGGTALRGYHSASAIADIIKVFNDGPAVAASVLFDHAFKASKSSLGHFSVDEAVDSIFLNYQQVLSRAFPEWCSWLLSGNGLKVEGLVVYLPSPPTGYAFTVIPGGKFRGRKLTLIAGGQSYSSRVFGVGLDMRGKGAKQYAQIWRMDYHAIHLVDGTKRFNLGTGSMSIIKDGSFHHHVCRKGGC